MTDEFSLRELTRAFLDFRSETREEIKWLRRLLIGTLTSAVAAIFLATAVGILVK